MSNHYHDVTKSPYYFKPPKNEQKVRRERVRAEPQKRVYNTGVRTAKPPTAEETRTFLALHPHLRLVFDAACATGAVVSLIRDKEWRIRPRVLLIDEVLWEMRVARVQRPRRGGWCVRITINQSTLSHAAMQVIVVDTGTAAHQCVYAIPSEKLERALFSSGRTTKKNADVCLQLPQDFLYKQYILNWPFDWQTPAA